MASHQVANRIGGIRGSGELFHFAAIYGIHANEGDAFGVFEGEGFDDWVREEADIGGDHVIGIQHNSAIIEQVRGRNDICRTDFCDLDLYIGAANQAGRVEEVEGKGTVSPPARSKFLVEVPGR